MSRMRLILFILAVTSSVGLFEQVEEQIQIHTRLGDIIGMRRHTDDGRNVTVFKKIPYAKPPVNNQRFTKPQPAGKWNSPLNATIYGPSCYHYISTNDRRLIPNADISEDCLILNIFIPGEVVPSASKAVMVWIHGGGFAAGQGMMFDGGELALRGDVILVTINYRLNVFGFFTTRDSIAPGNFGIWDQQMAIKWVKNNIHDYGGNPGLITIFGESAGGTSVNLHSISPKNFGLFQRVIVHSGTIIEPLDNGDKAKETSRLIANYVNCSRNSSKGIVNCLRKVPANDLLKAFSKAKHVVGYKHFSTKYALGPIQDGEFLPFDPKVAISKDGKSDNIKTFKSIDLIIGTNNGEAGLLKFDIDTCKNMTNVEVEKGISKQTLCKCMAPNIALESFDTKCNKIAPAICKKYSSKTNSLESQTSQAVNLYNDLVYYSPTRKNLDVHASVSNKTSYHYLFSHKPDWGLIQDRPKWLKGANHADELVFVFGLKAWYPHGITIRQEELLLSHQMMDYWTNFAKHGDPNGNTLTNWPEFITTRHSYMDLNLQARAKSSFFEDRMDFWLKKLPSLESHCKASSGVGNDKGRILFFVSVWITNLLVIWIMH